MAETANSPFALKTRETAAMPSEKKASALNVMAQRYSVEPDKLLATLKGTVFKGASNEELLALVVVANEYKLNPFLKQIYAFPAKGGGIVPVVSIDGWLKIVNEQPDLDGVEFEEVEGQDGKPVKTTCVISVKGRSKPIKVPERYSECHRNTDPWNKMPFRMLRHKALMQCARVAFGLGGFLDDDEARDIAKTPAATRATFDVPVDVTNVSEPQKQLAANATSTPSDDGDLGPADGVKTESVGTAAETVAEPKKEKKPAKEQPPISPITTLRALVTTAGFSDGETIELCVKKLNSPGVKTLEELPEEIARLAVQEWKLISSEIRHARAIG